ncbi:MAG: hypothetical protein ACI4P1_01935 [Erysipelotrichaceae bacterium]
MKRIRLLILSVLLIATLIPVSVYAEGGTSEPDVTVFATKEQMMDGTFAPNADGTADIKARIQFGKDDIGRDYQWFILKADQGVEGDNTIIFSMDFLADKRLFNSSSEAKIIYDYTKDDITVYSEIDSDNDGKVTVSGNHYGASDLRKDLIAMASNENMFSPAEQELMNATPIKTYDINNDVMYTTSDKLYAMSSGHPNNSSSKVKLGSLDQLTISTRTYVGSYPSLHGWLRTPFMGDDPDYGGKVNYLECLKTTKTVPYNSTIAPGIFVIPASNLNLTDVLFASAAKSGSSNTLGSSDAMTLRLDGKDKNLGEVYYDLSANEIQTTKGSTESKVYLIVQGKDPNKTGNNNWYYSKEITGTETIKASNIKQALGLSSDPSLANSKIWLETTDEDQSMVYAVEAKEVKAISNVEISIDAPVANKPLATSFTCTDGLNTDSISWKPKDTTAGYNKTYEASMTLSIKVGYRLADTVSATVNGEKATSVTKNDDGTLIVTYTFPCTQDRVISVTNPDTLTFKNGTSLESIFNSLPTKVTVTTESQKEIELPISWYKDPQLIYGRSDKGKQEFDIVGPVTLDDTFVRDDAVPTATIKVIVKAAEAPSSGNGSNHTVIIPDTSVK